MTTDATSLKPGGRTREHDRASELWGIGIVFGLVMIAVWIPPGRTVLVIGATTLLAIVVFTVRSGYSARQLGLSNPWSGALEMLVLGAVMAGLIAVAGFFTRAWGPAQPAPWHRVWQYALWAMLQQFMLQSFFFVRLESVVGAQRAVWAAAFLFAIPHIPNPLLTFLSFVGAVFFCEMFRRYRNLFPLGVIHAALGLTIAASFPDRVLHHMRVGLGYLMYRP
jgi:hypothetical protein